MFLKVIETLEAQQQAIQAKLTVGEPGDKYEQEADAMASKVMSMPDNAVQKESEENYLNKPLPPSIAPLAQMSVTPDGDRRAAGNNLESRLNSSKGGGSPLPHQVRSFMEPRFGADFSRVRVHTDTTAVQMNQELGAQAFTHGNNIYYGQGKAPGNNELTAHELTHVVQQTGRVQQNVIQRAINPSYPVNNGIFKVDATPSGGTLPIRIGFHPSVTAPYSNQIGLIQIVRITNFTGRNVDPVTLPPARRASLRTKDDPSKGIEGGYFTDVLHNDPSSIGGLNTHPQEKSPLPPQYPFNKSSNITRPNPSQPNPATTGLSRPFSSGGQGAIIGYKRSNDLANIKAAELSDAPGFLPPVRPAIHHGYKFEFETVAKGEDTNTIYGSLKWGFQVERGLVKNEQASVQEKQSATFDQALENHRNLYVHEPVIFYFDFNTHQLSSSEVSKIDTFLDYLQRFPDVKVTVMGFSDRRGNQELSLRRAKTVEAELLAKGIPDTQIRKVIGAGATEDFTPDATTNQDQEANLRGNRRVVLSFEYVPASKGETEKP